MTSTALPITHSLPPHYEALLPPPLPPYTCSVRLAGNFLYKRELDAPYQRTARRVWRRVHVELRGTLLLICKPGRRASPAAAVIKSYTLQAADAGLANDYHRRSHVLRIRAEGQQFLLAAARLATVVDWVDKLNTAIALSLPLESRREPRYCTVPGRKRAVAPPDAWDRVRRLWREEWWQWKSRRGWLDAPQSYPEGQVQCPVLLAVELEALALDGARSAASSPRSSTDRPSASASCPCAHCWRLPSQTTPAPLSILLAPSTRAPEASPLRPSTTLAWPVYFSDAEAEESPRSSVSSEADSITKWEPKPIDSTAQAKLEYAERCARVLVYTAPWKGRVYIRNGRRTEVVVPPPSTPRVTHGFAVIQ